MSAERSNRQVSDFQMRDTNAYFIGGVDELSPLQVALASFLCIALFCALGGDGSAACHLAWQSRDGGAHVRICRCGVNPNETIHQDSPVFAGSITCVR